MNIALINTNRIKPPIAPIGLEYVAETLQAAGKSVNILDLCWEVDAGAAIEHQENRPKQRQIEDTVGAAGQ